MGEEGAEGCFSFSAGGTGRGAGGGVGVARIGDGIPLGRSTGDSSLTGGVTSCGGGRTTGAEVREDPSPVRDTCGRVAVVGVCGSGVSVILEGPPRAGVLTPEFVRVTEILPGLLDLLDVAVVP